MFWYRPKDCPHLSYSLLEKDNVDDATNGDKECLQLPSHPKSRQTVPGLLLCLITVLVLTNSFWFYQVSRTRIDLSAEYYLQTSSGGRLPKEMAREYKLFEEDFVTDNLTVSTAAWATLFPDGNGTVAIHESEISALGLPPSVEMPGQPEYSVYLVAQFHQLHCLSQLRWIMNSYYFQENFSVPQLTWAHTMHCLDVIRQRLICAVDGTLMAKTGDQDPGVGALRTCGNFEALKDWTSARRAE